MKRKVLFAFVSLMVLFAFVFVLTSCNKTTGPTDNSGTIDVNPTNPDNPDDPGKIDPTNPNNPDNPGTDDNVFYTITFKDYDGTVLQTSSVKKGEMPAYNKSNPSRENDDNYSYTFSGWQPTLIKVSEDAIYTATYTSQSLYSITIDLDGGTSSATKLQFKTDKISKDMLPFDVKKSGYVFKGYSLNDVKVYDENGNVVSNYQSSANMTFKAIYEESVTLTVIYTLYNPKTGQLIETFNEKPTDLGNVSETKSYNYNTYVDLFAFANEGYTFVGWYNEGQVLSNEKDYKYLMWDEDFTIEARFNYTLYDLNVWSNNNDLGQVMIRSGNSQVFYNEETLQEYYTEAVTIVAYSKTDTRFLGWYDEKNELVSTNAVYTFDMLNRDYTLEAKWNNFNITYDLDGGTNNINNPTSYNVDMQNIALLNPAKQGYTFQGWQYKGNIITSINTSNICHMELKALWTYYTLTTNVNNSKAGSVSSYSNTKITKDKTVTITASTNPGYTFIGWYDGESKLTKELSYIFTMPAENLSYTAKWSVNTNTAYKVEHYLQNIDNTNYPTTPYEIDNLTGTTDTQTAGSVKTYEGFTSPSITQVNISGDGNTVIKLYYTRNSYSVILNKTVDKAGTVTGAGTYKYGKEITITASTNPGYTFIGWYDGESELTKELSYIFIMPAENLSYTAKWSVNTNTAYKVEHYLQNIDNTNYPTTPYEIDNLTGTTDTLTNGSVKTYVGFTSPSITQVNINGNGNTVIKLYYTRNSYSVTLNKTVDKAGTVTGAGTYKYGKEITITASTNPGYTFMGWYDGESELTKELSYIFTMSTENLSYTAKWSVNTNIAYKVEHYLQNIDNTNYPTTPYEIDNLTGTTDTLTNGSVKTYEGFTSPSITQVNINGNGNTVIKLYYTRNSYSVTLNKTVDKAGTVTGAGTYKYGKEITITASTNPGYTFIGWYKDNKEYTTDVSFDYEIESSNVSFEARYSINNYTITIDNQVEDVTISGITSGNEYEYDSQITLTATNIPLDKYLVWYFNDVALAYGASYTFTMPANNIVIKPVLTDTLENIVYTRNGNKIYFGSYPQTKVTDNTLISELNTLAGAKPTSTNKYNWTDYNYYISSSVTSFMFYQDLDYDNNGTYDYRGVYFIQYRPTNYSNSSSTSKSYQDDNGYTTNTIYWFSYDPIEWDILSESSGKALIIADLILDSQDYYPSDTSSTFNHNGGTGYANNYELSNIRKFLNDNFYNTAFNDLQKAFIETTTVDNSASSTASSSNSYACSNTNDKMFLLSYTEATTYYSSSSARMAKGTDYAKSQGLYVSTSSYYSGNSFWLLRSPYFNYAYGAYLVYDGGDVDYSGVSGTRSGVRPACYIIL